MRLIIAALLSVSTILIYAQQSQIQLLDTTDGLPIIGASFKHGDQNGVSDENGIIRFNLIPEKSVKISHVTYGTWELTAEKLAKLIQKGLSFRQASSVNLYPLTIIGVKSGTPDDRLDLGFQERMEHDGASILNQIPAFNSIRKSGNYGFDPVFRGFKYDQLNVVLNGAQSATAACPNRMDPPTSQMAPNMIDRLEVLKGPYALRYGTGFGATLNFIPSNLRFTDEFDIYGRVSSGYFSNGNVRRGESQLGFTSSKFDISFFGAWSEGDNYLTGNGVETPAAFRRGSFGTNIGFKLNAHQQIRLSATYNRARDVDFASLPMDLRKDDTWMINARHDIHFENKNLKSWNSTVFGSFVDHKMDNLLKELNPRMMNASTIALTYNYGGRTEGIWHFNKNHVFIGADVRVEGADGTRTREFLMGPMAGNLFLDNVWQQGQITKSGVFSEFHINASKVSYILSGRMELNQASITDPSEEFQLVHPNATVTHVNPSWSFGILRPYGEKINLGLWMGRAQRSGGLSERFINFFPIGQDPYEMVGNPDLKPEVNNQVDLTFDWKGDKAALSVDVFGTYLQDYISSVIDPFLSPRLPNSPGVRNFINIGEAMKTGVEISVKQSLTSQLKHQLDMAFTYAQDLERNEPLPETPPMDVRYSILGSFVKDKLSPEVSLRTVAAQQRISQEFGEMTTPGFSLIDVKLGYAISNNIKVQGGVLNLLDENYYEHLSRSISGTTGRIYAPGRNYFLNANWMF